MNKLLKLIRNFLGRETIVHPVVDKVLYSPDMDSFAGHSMESSNVLIVFRGDKLNHAMKCHLEKEDSSIAFCSCDKKFDFDKIKCAESSLIGPFTHIINIFSMSPSENILDQFGLYNNDDMMGLIYRTLQIEVDYLVKNDAYATISSAFILQDDCDSKSMAGSFKLCIEGLAPLLANHNLICNAVIASESTPYDVVAKTLTFLSSKYGQVMTGQTIELKNV